MTKLIDTEKSGLFALATEVRAEKLWGRMPQGQDRNPAEKSLVQLLVYGAKKDEVTGFGMAAMIAASALLGVAIVTHAAVLKSSAAFDDGNGAVVAYQPSDGLDRQPNLSDDALDTDFDESQFTRRIPRMR